MEEQKNFTQGKILSPLIKFALPVLLALFLQAMYGAVDLMVVGQFGTPADVSAVSTGSQILLTFTSLISSFAMGATVLLAQQIGRGEGKNGSKTVGACLALFSLFGLFFTAAVPLGAPLFSTMMQAPPEAFDLTVAYVRICGGGILVIIAYNLIGSVFRGIGDSKTPLFSVAVACVFNIGGDLFFVAVLHMGTAGAAIATVLAQLLSVVISLLLIKKKRLPFTFKRKYIRLDKDILKRVTKLGLPIAMQDLLVGLSFLIIQAIVNSLGLIPSAGVGAAEKVCAFIMLVPAAFMQSMSAFVAQNVGAKKFERADRALLYGVVMSFAVGVAMFYLSFFHGDLLTGLFAKDTEVILAGADYLKAYAIDCLLTAFLFCFLGYYNGMGMTRFVMIQGIIGAFGVRVPVSYLMSRIQPVSLFHIALATPCSTVLQITMCMVCLAVVRRKRKRRKI